MILDPRVDDAIKQIRDQIEEKDESREDDDHGLKSDVIPVLYCEDHHLSQTGPAEDDLREH